LATQGITHRQRVENCLNGGDLDRVPVALWRHFPVDDQSPGGLAAATVQFQRTFDFDFVKVTPASSFCLKDWGVDDEWRGSTEGTRDYVVRVIHAPDDWTELPVLNPRQGHLAAQLESLRLISEELGADVPVIQTIFNPLTQAKNLIGKDKLFVHLRQYPEALHEGLKIITESTRRFVEAIKELGIAGIFYAVQHAQYGLLSEAEYSTFGQRYDLQVLDSANEFWLNVLHLHGENIMFDQFVNYPVMVVNWHDQDTEPTLSEGLERFPGIVCGGLKREQTMVLGTQDAVTAEARDAQRVTNGERFILGTGCVVPITAPYGNILAARRSVERKS
jgi:uroporphyrinogen decarboxylase